VAYCGVGDDGNKTYAIVAQLSRGKAVLNKPLPNALAENAPPDSACSAPTWERSPVRVSFKAAGGETQTFAIRGTVVDVVDAQRTRTRESGSDPGTLDLRSPRSEA